MQIGNDASKVFGVEEQLFRYSKITNDQILNMISTIQSQLFEYQIIQFICCNSDLIGWEGLISHENLNIKE